MADPAEGPLQRLAGRIAQAGLRAPALLLLETFGPLDLICAQLASFGRPLAGGTSLDPYLAALSETAGWEQLRRLLAEEP